MSLDVPVAQGRASCPGRVGGAHGVVAAAYVRAVTDDVAKLVAQRVLTKEDGDDLIAEAKARTLIAR